MRLDRVPPPPNIRSVRGSGGDDAMGRRPAGPRRRLSPGLRLALIGLLALLALPLLVDDSPVSAQTANSVAVPAAISVPEEAGTFSVTFTGDPGANAAAVGIYADGTATGQVLCSVAGADFDNNAIVAASFTSGQSSHVSPAIVICGDSRAEADETYTITWMAAQSIFDSSAANCSSGTVCTTTVTIVDDDRVVPVPSNWGLKPSGVDPGESFRLFFITSGNRDASETDIGSYNEFVQTAAGGGHAQV